MNTTIFSRRDFATWRSVSNENSSYTGVLLFPVGPVGVTQLIIKKTIRYALPIHNWSWILLIQPPAPSLGGLPDTSDPALPKSGKRSVP
jgi:hypothetical protein